MKTCTKCGVSKALDDFPISKRSKDGRHTACKKCRSADSRAHYYANKEKYLQRDRTKETWGGDLKRRFGITQDEYLMKLKLQGNACAICRKTPAERRLAVDHDHETGANRGLLCTSCNMGLGYFKDNPNLLLAALRYLTQYKHGK